MDYERVNLFVKTTLWPKYAFTYIYYVNMHCVRNNRFRLKYVLRKYVQEYPPVPL